MADEHGLATPLDRNGGADGDGANVNLGGAHGQRVGGRRPLGHGGNGSGAAKRGPHATGGAKDQVGVDLGYFGRCDILGEGNVLIFFFFKKRK